MTGAVGFRGEALSLFIDPGLDLLGEIENFFNRQGARMGAVFSATGMLDGVQLIQLGRNTTLRLEGLVELISASGIIRREDDKMSVNLRVMVSKGGRLFAGNLASGCVAAHPEGVTVFLSVIGKEG